MQALRYFYSQKAITIIIDYLYMCSFRAQQAALKAQQSLGSTMVLAEQHYGSQAALQQQAEVFKRPHTKMICRLGNAFDELGNITGLQIHCAARYRVQGPVSSAQLCI